MGLMHYLRSTNADTRAFSVVASQAPNSGLLGSSPKEAALIEQWISFVDTELDPSRKFLAGLLGGNAVPYNKPVSQFAS